MKKFILLLIFIFFTILAQNDCIGADDVNANYVMLMDYDTDEILYQKNINEISFPSSMTKMMTAYIIFDMLENGEIDINDKFKVSIRAWKQDGTRMFLEPEWRINVDELLKGLLIVSGNDAAIVLAEGSTGSIENFVMRMNETARTIGMNNTNFTNPTGLYEKNHYTSVRDLAILAKSLIRNHNKYYKRYFSEKNYNFNNISQKNRNWLLTEYSGVDGIKTGFTEQGKYSIVTSVERKNKRFILVINGARSERERITLAKKLFDYAFSQYEYIELFKSGEIVDDVGIFFGTVPRVSVYTKEDIVYTTHKSKIQNLNVQLVYNKYIVAPIQKDEKIAKIRIIEGDNIKEYDLYSREEVKTLTRFRKLKILLKYNLKSLLHLV
jgi:D-alanyl-D-alanine carboxypeptidase (penicillin-binding protein 5/6)